MIIKNSIRQLWRMKGRTSLFVLLLLLASGLCSLGMGFRAINARNIEKYEDTFTTIGTVTQKPKAVVEGKTWDAEQKDYELFSQLVYDSFVPLSVLDFEGADYLSGPEKRISYGAYCPEYEMYSSGLNTGIVAEVSPLEDETADHPISMHVTRVLYGESRMENTNIKFCDHNNPYPDTFYKDKTYVMSLFCISGHESEKESEGDYVSEYVPRKLLGSAQRDESGNQIPDGVGKNHFYDEVTEGFYDTPIGKRWMNLIESFKYVNHIFPVTGTSDIHLMMPFYKGDVYVNSGREFTAEEYERGDKVCIVWEQFAVKNGLKIGDRLELPLIYADYYRPAGMRYSTSGIGAVSLLNAKGEIYSVFEDSSYEIIGTYRGNAGLYDEYGMGYNEIIIPGNSVKNSDAENIIDYGPLRGCTTSFQIENGTINEFLEKWSKLGIDDLEFTFYDKGYTKLQAGIENMKQLAGLLIVMGAVMVLLVLGYFTWLFILKQKERTAIERSLGFTRKQSFLSLFAGIFLILMAGGIGGGILGASLSGRIAENVGDASYYDTSFGSSAAVSIEDAEEEAEEFYPIEAAVQTIAGILLLGSVIAGAGIGYNLRQEPMEMFGK